MFRARNAIRLMILVVLGAWPAAPWAAAENDWLEALKQRDWVAIQDLAGRGVDVNQPSEKGATALMRAADAGRSEVVELLIEAGADVNAANPLGGSALMYACKTGDPETSRVLLDHGADVNAVSVSRWTPIMLAVVKGHDRIIEILLQRGANPNSADIYGWTPLMRAVERNRPASVRVLLADAATDINMRNEHGATALHYAVARGDVDMSRRLVARGADISAEDAKGRTPLEVANGRGHSAIVQLLEEHLRSKQGKYPG